MTLKRHSMDTIGGIREVIETNAPLFIGLKDHGNPFAVVSKYRQDVEKLLGDLDQRMCVAMNDIGDRTMWADKMRSCHKMMRVITMNLAVWGKSEYDWNEVGQAMAFLRAVTQGAELTLSLNEPEEVEK